MKFVLVNSDGWRIECELVDAEHPASDHSFYPLNREVAARVCSQLNEMVQNGLIVIREQS